MTTFLGTPLFQTLLKLSLNQTGSYILKSGLVNIPKYLPVGGPDQVSLFTTYDGSTLHRVSCGLGTLGLSSEGSADPTRLGGFGRSASMIVIVPECRVRAQEWKKDTGPDSKPVTLVYSGRTVTKTQSFKPKNKCNLDVTRIIL